MLKIIFCQNEKYIEIQILLIRNFADAKPIEEWEVWG